MEHTERFDDERQAIKEDLDELEQQGDEMDEGTDELQQDTEEVAEDFETKRNSSEVPGRSAGRLALRRKGHGRAAYPFGCMPRNRAAGSAFAIAAFVTGIVVWFVNPPSLSGAGGLISLLIGASAFVIVTAWVTTRLMGSDLDQLPEEEFERIVVRSEELARRPKLAQEATEFELIVADALDRLPAEFQEVLKEVPVIVSQRGYEFHAYGHYYGDSVAGGRFEHRIVIYQDTLTRDFGGDPDVLAAQVERVVRHEVAHHLGWNESGVRGLGL